jgi:Rod binding domain-containing protein
MTALSAQTVPLNILTPTPMAPTANAKSSKAQIEQTAQSFESQFLANMLGQMFDGVSTSGPFGGGEGESAFRSFLMDAFAQQITKSGGVGIAASVQKEMLKMQEVATQ